MSVEVSRELVDVNRESVEVIRELVEVSRESVDVRRESVEVSRELVEVQRVSVTFISVTYSTYARPERQRREGRSKENADA